MKDPMDKVLLDFNASHRLTRDQETWLIIEIQALRKRVKQLEGVIHEMGAAFPPELIEQLSKTL